MQSISFDVRAGEILGIAGVQGNGQTELCEALMGLRPSTGSVVLDGADISAASTRDRLRAGIGYIPEDRQEDGLVGAFTVADNLVLDVYDRPPYAAGHRHEARRDQEGGGPAWSTSTTSGRRRC